jgi:ubiquitin carboxyl-terminal hydrolase 5/13
MATVTDIDTPLQQPSGDVKAAPQVDEAAVSQIIDMGFTRVQAIKALGATNNSVERAMDWLFSHGGADDDIMDVDQPQASVNSPSTPVSKHFIDGPGSASLHFFFLHR